MYEAALSRLGHIAVYTADMDAASPFMRKSAAVCISGPPPARRNSSGSWPGGVRRLSGGADRRPRAGGRGCIPHFAVYVDDVDQAAADLKAAGVDTFRTPEKCVMPNTFGGLENWFFTGPPGSRSNF